MLTFKLAFRNITHAGLRTWLNVIVLSFAFVLIVFTQGLYDGMEQFIMRTTIESEIGGGQFWQRNYDPFDPLTLEDAHAPLSPGLTEAVAKGEATPLLFTSGAIFPEGRIQPTLLKGIDPDQRILSLPSDKLKTATEPGVVPAFIGARMAKNTGLKTGDYVTVRWRDVNGTFDAIDLKIVAVMNTNVQTVDAGQVWIPLNTLRQMLQTPGEATMVVLSRSYKTLPAEDTNWVFRDQDYLLSDLRKFIRSKKMGSYFMYALLLGMALLAIFDTQVLSIFRRRKEMGTLMALGMTRGQVISLFTTEGSFHGLLAVLVGAVYGIPLLAYAAVKGIGLPEMTQKTGLAFGATLYPTYSVSLFIGTSILLFLAVLVVSFLPTRKISRLKPTDALRGKLS